MLDHYDYTRPTRFDTAILRARTPFQHSSFAIAVSFSIQRGTPVLLASRRDSKARCWGPPSMIRCRACLSRSLAFLLPPERFCAPLRIVAMCTSMVQWHRVLRPAGLLAFLVHPSRRSAHLVVQWFQRLEQRPGPGT